MKAKEDDIEAEEDGTGTVEDGSDHLRFKCGVESGAVGFAVGLSS